VGWLLAVSAAASVVCVGWGHPCLKVTGVVEEEEEEKEKDAFLGVRE